MNQGGTSLEPVVILMNTSYGVLRRTNVTAGLFYRHEQVTGRLSNKRGRGNKLII